MKNKGTLFGVVVMLTAALLLGLTLAGCKNKSGPAAPTKAGEAPAAPVTTPPAAVKGTTPAAIQQTTCPVMGKPINKDIFTKYQGKKVYFCCAGCKKKFENAPKEYIGKLPQFK